MNVKQDDTVLVIAGKDRGKRGRVREVHPTEGKVIVEGINIVKRHTRGQRGARQAGIVEREAPLDASNVMVVCPNCDKGARIGHEILDNGQKVRRCSNCGQTFDRDAQQDKWGGRR